MNRRRILIGGLALIVAQAAAALPVLAASFVEQIVTQLEAQGFKDIDVETTWLGRARISAERADISREIVLNPNTGEILRDLWLSKSGANSKTITIGDDGGDDNSGHGGGDSGSGGGDDGSGDDGGGDDGGGDDGGGDHEGSGHD